MNGKIGAYDVKNDKWEICLYRASVWTGFPAFTNLRLWSTGERKVSLRLAANRQLGKIYWDGVLPLFKSILHNIPYSCIFYLNPPRLKPTDSFRSCNLSAALIFIGSTLITSSAAQLQSLSVQRRSALSPVSYSEAGRKVFHHLQIELPWYRLGRTGSRPGQSILALAISRSMYSHRYILPEMQNTDLSAYLYRSIMPSLYSGF